MIIKPRVRGFICTNAHPTGCAANVQEQIDYIKGSAIPTERGPKNVLVIGASTGYGLATRITAAFGYGANTLGVFYEKPASEKRTGTAGFYNAAAFEEKAKAEGLYAKSINGDAFSDAMKTQVIEAIKADMGSVDLVVYSLASPKRTDPKTGEVYNSVLKTIGESYTAKNLNTDTRQVGEVTIDPASDAEIQATVKVMGGEDWAIWLQALAAADVLADGAQTTAYTYLGDKITWPIYGHATIGKAKEDLDRTANELNQRLARIQGQARVAVLKALVTQASSAIPVMPLYMSILFKLMKARGTHEGCIEQIQRLFTEGLYADAPRVDGANRLRVDEKELNSELQAEVEAVWSEVTSDNVDEMTDIDGYNTDFLKLFGFGVSGVDYEADVSPLVRADF
ncbi:MAG: enoyl-ACP reductase FabV [Candidatus Thiodiazotropha sp.]